MSEPEVSLTATPSAILEESFVAGFTARFVKSLSTSVKVPAPSSFPEKAVNVNFPKSIPSESPLKNERKTGNPNF